MLGRKLKYYFDQAEFHLPIKKQRKGARFASLPFLLLLSLFSFELSAQNDNFDPVVFRILYSPTITQETLDRQKMTRGRDQWGPIKESPLDGAGFRIQTVDQLVPLSEIKAAEKDLKTIYPISKFTGTEIVMAAALAPIMAMQIRAADWYPRMPSGRLHFAYEVFTHYAHRATKIDPYMGRRHYILDEVTKKLALPFNLNDFFERGRFVPGLMDEYFSGIEKLLTANTENPESEFADYIAGLCRKFDSMIDEQELHISWGAYRMFPEREDLVVRPENLGNPETLAEVKALMAGIIADVLSQIRFQKVSMEDYYAYIYVHEGFDLDFNSPPGTYLTAKKNELGPTSLPDMRIELDRETTEVSVQGIKREIYDQVNPFYLTAAFKSEMTERLLESPRSPFSDEPNFARNYHRREPHRRDIEQLYAQRVTDPTERLELAKTWQMSWWKAEIPLPEDFEEGVLSSYYLEIYREQMRWIQAELAPAYASEARAEGFESIQAAAEAGYGFPRSLTALPELRAEAFQALVERLSERLFMAEAKTENPRVEGTMAEVRSELGESLGPQAAEVDETLAQFAARETQSHRQAFVVKNFVEVSEGEDRLVLWMPEGIEITDVVGLYDNDHNLYFEYEEELRDSNTFEAYRLGLIELVGENIRYWDASGTDWESKLPSSQEELLDSLTPAQSIRIIELAAIIEHQRSLEEDLWWRNDFVKRYK